MLELRDPLQEEDLLDLMKNKDSPPVMEKLIVHNLKLVYWIASKYSKNSRPGREFEDLVQEGIIGLIRAIKDYEPNKGSWGSYASLHIKGSIVRAISNKGRAIRLPVHYIGEIQEFKEVEKELIRELQREPTNKELAEALEVEVKKIEDYKIHYKVVDSLDEELNEEGYRKLDTLIYEGASVEESALEGFFMGEFKNYFSDKLTDLQLQGLRLYYGLDCPEHTQEEIAKLYNVSNTYINMEIKKALLKVRESEFIKELDEYTIWVKGQDFTTPRAKGGLPYSPVERVVLQRDRLRQRFISKEVDNIIMKERGINGPYKKRIK